MNLWFQTSFSPGATLRSPRMASGAAGVAAGHLGGQSLEEVELMVEFRIARPIRLITAGRNVEIVHLDSGDRP